MNPVQWIIRRIKKTPLGETIHYLKTNAELLDEPPHYLSIAACVKNEGRYLREWIEYHLWAGVEHFYIYDNGSTDNTREVLAPYVMDGKVTYRYNVSERHPNLQPYLQCRIYEDAIVRYKCRTRWLALIDVDEFLALSEEGKKEFGCSVVTGGGLIDFFKLYEKYPGIGINWICFDSGGREKMPESGFVIENYTRTEKDNDTHRKRFMKSVVQPLQVKYCRNPHFCFYKRFQKAVNENLQPLKAGYYPNSTRLIRINHYSTKSKEEYLAKIQRGHPDDNRLKYTEDSLNYPETKVDNVMQEAAEALRARGVPETYGASL